MSVSASVFSRVNGPLGLGSPFLSPSRCPRRPHSPLDSLSSPLASSPPPLFPHPLTHWRKAWGPSVPGRLRFVSQATILFLFQHKSQANLSHSAHPDGKNMSAVRREMLNKGGLKLWSLQWGFVLMFTFELQPLIPMKHFTLIWNHEFQLRYILK